jgi:hypothetical protein
MSTRPSTKDASLQFDLDQIQRDSEFISSFDGDLTSALRSLIVDRQSQSAHLHLHPSAVDEF